MSALSTAAQPVAIANPGFESGDTLPTGWQLSGGVGDCMRGDEGNHAAAVSGNGEDSNYWRTEGALPFEPGGIYQLDFRARRVEGATGAPITGPSFCNRDLYELGDAWEDVTSVFTVPDTLTPDAAWLRFGQWQVDGRVAYDDIRLVRAQPVYAHAAEFVLGEGERIEGDRYTFHAPLGTLQTNHSRPLAHNSASFNSHRWVFAPGSTVEYVHQVGDRSQTAGHARIQLNYHEGGELVVKAGTDGENWLELATLAAVDTLEVDIPPALLPAPVVRVRLEARLDGGSFQIDGYQYTATLDRAVETPLTGATHYAAVEEVAEPFDVTVEALRAEDGSSELHARVSNHTGEPMEASATLRIQGEDVSPAAPEFSETVHLAPGLNELAMPYAVPAAGALAADFQLASGEHRFRSRTRFRVPILEAADYGERLAENDGGLLWWASSGWKVSKTRPAPEATGDALRIALARNEAESAQLIVRPARGLQGLRAHATDLAGPGGATLAASAVDVRYAGYVNVSTPTDNTATTGWWPDPLPPLGEQGIGVAAGENQPLWITVTTSHDTPPGEYRGTLVVTCDGFQAEAPLVVTVYDFTLPHRMTCQTAFGFDPGLAFQYHGVHEEAQQRQVYADYLRLLGEYRIAPYSPNALDPMKYEWPEVPENVDPADWAQYRPKFDWTAWDAAVTRGFEEYGFNVLQIPVPGMGSGTFHSRSEPELLGFEESDPRYQVLFRGWVDTVAAHLQEKGWLDASFVYWFDEPDPKDYEFVMNGFRKLQAAAPGLPRMLTEQPEPELIGGPNLWCPLTPAFNMDEAEALRAKGDRFWWYVCTAPKGKFATLFIDHAVTELRVWLWQTWERKIDGVLVWQTNYWTSNEAYPDAPQNPYEDPMGWTTGYSTPSGAKLPWGNGDGRFIYPPLTAANGQPASPVLDPPVPSIRLAMLRDGVEDYEYHAILARLLEEHTAALTEAERARYAELLVVPETVTQRMTKFTLSPAPIEARRAELAAAIEALVKK
jgi:hypothetical protein